MHPALCSPSCHLTNNYVVMEREKDDFGYDSNIEASNVPPTLPNDATNDQHHDGAFTGRSVDLNRELPALPVDERNQKFLTINTGCPSLTLSSSNLGSAKTFSSATHSSTVSSKKDFRHLAHGLMNPDSVDSLQKLSASYEPLEPTKFNPSETRKPLPKLKEQ